TASTEVCGHHQRGPRRSARRRCGPLCGMHSQNPRTLAHHPNRSAGARLPGPRRPRPGDPQSRTARRHEPQHGDRAAPVQGSAPGRRLPVQPDAAQALQGRGAARPDQERPDGRPGRDRRGDPRGHARHAR
ncbi:putative Lipoic acid synthase, partial [Daphnia magna]